MKSKYVLIMSAALLVSACDKGPAIESVESLVVNPDRLRELRAQCKADHAKVGDAQCNAVAEATRQRFMSGGKAHIPAVSQPASSPASAASSDIPKD
ncbi:EexN family lipoprotein [Acidovorax sp. Leaf73]|uniref:EexN family lipoprotein n=1 Tax=Acidovorax sp. Leaf73 TaxID=2876566 RepID=UPI001E34B939|nr:EexN family lipoprotein [Acidovorax sp. Leaf73]